MHYLRTIARALTGLCLGLLLLILPLISVASYLTKDPDTIKTALKESDIYAALATEINNPANYTTDNQATSEVLKSDAFRTILTQAFPESYIQDTTNRTIDAFYGWLKGSAPQPTLPVQAADIRQRVLDSANSYAEQRAQTLPTCTVSQLQNASAETDPLTATCIPAGTDRQALIRQINERISTEVGIPESSTQTLTVPPEAQAARDTIRNLGRLLYWAVMLSIVLAAVYVWLHADRRHGVRSLGYKLATSGLGVVAISGIAWMITRSVNVTTAQETSTALERALLQAGSSLGLDILRIVLVWGAAYLVIGVVLAVALRKQNTVSIAGSGPTPPTTPISQTPLT